MAQDEVVTPDDGTPLRALAELRRAMGNRFDRNTAEALHAVERAQGAVIQGDNAKTLQEEIRHLIRALAATTEAYIVTPKAMEDAYRAALQSLEQQVAALTQAIPRMPAAPDDLAQRVTGIAAQLEAFLSRCQERARSIEGGLVTEIKSLTGELRRAARDLEVEATATHRPRGRRDFLILLVGLWMGLMVGALTWRKQGIELKPRPRAEASFPYEPAKQAAWS